MADGTAGDRGDRRVVTCVLRHGTEVLLRRRSDAVGTYPGRWGFVSGDAEGSPAEQARREIAEEVGLLEDCRLVRSADPLTVDDGLGVRWHVHPFLFECGSTAVVPNEEVADLEWVQPPAIRERETVPGLWETYRAVAPSVETVRSDDEHGSAHVSLRALEVLRDRAADVVASDTATPDASGDFDSGGGYDTGGGDNTSGGYDAVADCARDLRDARRSMGVIATRVDRVMATADRSPGSVLDRAVEACDRAVSADADAAANGVDAVGDRVLTLSRSGTVLATLRRADPDAVFVAESRPAREGVAVAEALADDGLDVSLCVDAAMAHVVERETVDTVLFGADAVLADGTVVNKVGSRLAALAAASAAGPVDCLVVCSRDKIVPDAEPTLESGPPGAVYEGDGDVGVHNPTFEGVPPDLVDGVLTEDGALSTDDVAAVAAEHEAFANWDV